MTDAIRAALDADAGAIAELSGQLGYPARTEDIERRLRAIHERGDGQVYVAEMNGAVVGWVHVFGSRLLEAPPHAEIGGLVVDERHRGRGIGKALVAAVERWAASMRYGAVRVRSNTVREAAHRFYEGLGYQAVKRQVAFTKSVAIESDREHTPHSSSA